jgi:poly(3-hydroxybutyrate) depolymerase
MLKIILLMLFSYQLCMAATSPAQPESGPGGKEYSHSTVTKSRYGEGAEEYWLYEPASPKPYSAPVIIFLHGWGATNPKPYEAWMEHLVKRGNIVIYPRYQKNARSPLKELTANTIDAIQNALNKLENDTGHVKADVTKFAVVGHSAGGVISANVAALAKEIGMPEVLALMPVEPGRTWNIVSRGNIPLEDMSKISSNTLLLSVIGDKDSVARDIDAKRIFYESTQISLNNKDFVTMISDSHGSPPLNANHFAPTAPINALDFYGMWKLFDGLCDAAFYGKNRKYAMGNTTEQRFMGLWSDGRPVKELVVTDKP